MRAISLSGVAFLIAITAAEGATIEIIRSAPDEPTIFAIEGELQYGDERKFSDKAIGAPEGIVVLSSGGGNLVAGIEIGKAIRLKGFVTLVPDETYCASACGLAWLGGQRRFMGPKARVGFHAASKKEGGEERESGVANALVGAYLNSLGLSQSAVFYVTHTPPAKMTWLTFEEAAENGIEVRRFDSAGLQQPPIAPKPETAPLREPPKTATIPPQPTPSDPPRDNRRTALGLDLLELNAAASVQRRLMNLGFFTGLIDGVWGPRSRIALRDFKVHNGLLPNE